MQTTLQPSPATPASLLIVLQLPLYEREGEFYIERQACNGLRLWLDNFGSVTLCLPLHVGAVPPADTLPVRQAVSGALRIEALPLAWSPVAFAKAFNPTRKRLARLIDTHDYLHFSVGGLFGDWGGVAAMIAHRRGRKSSVWTDRVESTVMAFQAEEYRGVRRVYRRLCAGLAKTWEQYVIRRSHLGLFHGMDTFAAFSPFSANPHLVHNIHVPPSARISSAALEEKCRRAGRVRIVYGGRVHPDKGVMDWIHVLAAARADFSATWHGDGPQLDEARAEVRRLGMDDRISFPGPTATHGELLDSLREADICLFCHKTPESPRVLIEALLSATPIVGYDAPYPRDLIAAHGGGMLSPIHDVEALARNLTGLAADRAALGEMMQRAARDGFPLVDEEVFRHRSDLIKHHLPRRQQEA